MKGDRDLAHLNINDLVRFIKDRKERIKKLRIKYTIPELRLSAHENIRNFIVHIRAAQCEIDWRKQNDLWKLKDVRKYWAKQEKIEESTTAGCPHEEKK